MHGIGNLNFEEPEEEGLVKVTLPESEDVIFIRAPSS
jgi:hypothetical protein